jgi:predicted ester cyclase
MTDQSPAVVCRLLIEAINANDLDAAEKYIAAEAVNHVAPPGTEPGVKGFRAGWEMLKGAFPDFHFVIEQSVESGDTVSSRYTNIGTQEGEFAGIPASGRTMEVLGLDMVRVRDGQVVEHWAVMDMAAIAAQLGAGAGGNDGGDGGDHDGDSEDDADG